MTPEDRLYSFQVHERYERASVSTRSELQAEAKSPGSSPAEMREKLRSVFKTGGVYYGVLFLGRRLIEKLLELLDWQMVATEQKRLIVEPWAVGAKRHTSQGIGQFYEEYDWSEGGEEWTKDSAWKEAIVERFLLPNIRAEGNNVEIGPGGGRWTEFLQKRSATLSIVDISRNTLDACRRRFEDCANIDYLLSKGHDIALPDESVDSLWSYDVFVHINPMEARGYFEEIGRVLKQGGQAVIHYPGPPAPYYRKRAGYRSDLTDAMIERFAAENQLSVVHQTDELVNPGDVLSVFEKAGPDSK